MILRFFILIALALSLALPLSAPLSAGQTCPSQSQQMRCLPPPSLLGALPNTQIELPCAGKAILARFALTRPCTVAITVLSFAHDATTLKGITGGGIDRPPQAATF